jgi:hypothetical protein
MGTYIKQGATQIDFDVKPVWKDRWRYRLDHVGSEIGVIGEGVVSQRFVLPGNAGKKMTLLCPMVTATQLALLVLMANHNTGPLEVKPEDAATTYSAIFAAENPLGIEQHAGEFPDEDKETVGPPYDRYKATLNLIVV